MPDEPTLYFVKRYQTYEDYKEAARYNRTKVPKTTDDWFRDIQKFYQHKHIQHKAPIFSSYAAEKFPEGWHAAFEQEIWEEEGYYGDSFREYFSLQKYKQT